MRNLLLYLRWAAKMSGIKTVASSCLPLSLSLSPLPLPLLALQSQCCCCLSFALFIHYYCYFGVVRLVSRCFVIAAATTRCCCCLLLLLVFYSCCCCCRCYSCCCRRCCCRQAKFTKKFQLKCNNAALHHRRRLADKPRAHSTTLSPSPSSSLYLPLYSSLPFLLDTLLQAIYIRTNSNSSSSDGSNKNRPLQLQTNYALPGRECCCKGCARTLLSFSFNCFTT